MMRFRLESVAEIWDELVPLARLHHEQHAIPWAFHVERAAYEAQERAGILAVFSMRDENGSLHGYQVFMVMLHPHFRCMYACQDTIYILPKDRGFWSGKFLLWVERELEKLGAQQIIRYVAQAADCSEAMKRLGYEPGDKILTRRVHNG
jgi:hypothetical protein